MPSQLPLIPDAPLNHRLRTVTVLATCACLLVGLSADYGNGPLGRREHVFTGVRNLLQVSLPRALSRVSPPRLARRCARRGQS